VPGDRIEIVRKELYVNDKRVDDGLYAVHRDQAVFPNQPIYPRRGRLRDNLAPLTVPDGEYFFLGDNRDYSHDSRFWGTVPRHFIKGRALLVYWSNGGETSDGQWRGWGRKLTQVGKTLKGFVVDTRWRRTFHLIR
jgi:signal peptidase I